MLLDDKGGMDELGMEGRHWVTLPCYLNNRDGCKDIMIDPTSDVEKTEFQSDRIGQANAHNLH